MNRSTLAAAAALATLAAPAFAQDAIMALNPTTMIGYAGTTAGNAYKPRDFGPQLNRTRSQPRAPAQANPAAVLARTAFQPSAAVRQQAYARAVAVIGRASPEDGARLRTALSSGQIRTAAARYLGNYGMSPNNLVDTTALYLASAWFAAHANGGDPTPAQMKGLRRQVALTYSTMPRVLAASSAAKQELAEANIIQAVIAGALANQAAADPKIRGTVRTSVSGAVRETYGLDLTRLNLTAQGLR